MPKISHVGRGVGRTVVWSEIMDELVARFRSMRVDADQAIQLLTSGDFAAGPHKIDDPAVLLDRLKTWREELDRLIKRYGDPRAERA